MATPAPELRLAQLRREYTQAGLKEQDLAPDPILQFQRWFEDALNSGIIEPNAMVLATADSKGRPSSRMVLLKQVDARGFVFFTNYASRKGRELTTNPHASLTFPWHALERQVCVIGTVTKVPRDESEEYFKLRPRGSRLGANVSRQSEVVLSGRETLERRLAELDHQHPGENIPMPAEWGGYVLAPEEIEFWQGRPNRLHDRLRYRRDAERWVIERLSP
ncbi:MAG TPA: pyridoxamine 5'-phosphate oxidase [Candidatus Binatia bacterium]|nr:pyridoxamine 5'-phosphate oxidase [Candidatus Binatia bacterium]